jgi:hypothetical protein
MKEPDTGENTMDRHEIIELLQETEDLPPLNEDLQPVEINGVDISAGDIIAEADAASLVLDYIGPCFICYEVSDQEYCDHHEESIYDLLKSGTVSIHQNINSRNPPIATLEITRYANCDDIAFLIEDRIEKEGDLKAESNQDGTYDISRI